MRYPKHPILRSASAALALALTIAAAHAQQPADSAAMAADSLRQAAPAAPSQASSDQNVPPATARKQAAEVAGGDPQRWYQEDVTPEARLRSLQKEMAAGLQEAKGNCRRQPTAERADCLKQARAIYQSDMAKARSRVMAEPAR